jgi:hypothetical protein
MPEKKKSKADAGGATRVSGGILYRGEKFRALGWAGHKKAKSPKKKWRLLAKKTVAGQPKYKIVEGGAKGMQDFRQHKNPKRRKSFRARAGAIKNKSGKLTKNDKFSPNYYNMRNTW